MVETYNIKIMKTSHRERRQSETQKMQIGQAAEDADGASDPGTGIGIANKPQKMQTERTRYRQ